VTAARRLAGTRIENASIVTPITIVFFGFIFISLVVVCYISLKPSLWDAYR
jgi:hypothetical protein